ncbi:MAG: SCO1664 family protein [Acidimicrobiia bacterium]|nr:SCO1664 family protein [Acidimicrobiia bacterium]
MRAAWPVRRKTAIDADAWPPAIAELEGRFVDASNATLLARTVDGRALIYKPEVGQRPLHDFDVSTLPRREYLAFRVSEIMQLDCVPRTAIVDGPAGPGSVQEVVEHETDVSRLVDMVNSADAELWPIALLDILINNADRKAGHIFLVRNRAIGIDHGLAFHTEDKLRTVLWSFAGMKVPESLLQSVEVLIDHEDVFQEVTELLGEPEARAFRSRSLSLLNSGVHPLPPIDRPAMPWPHF